MWFDAILVFSLICSPDSHCKIGSVSYEQQVAEMWKTYWIILSKTEWISAYLNKPSSICSEHVPGS